MAGSFTIVGAGVVGLCLAARLRRAGGAVTVIDPLPPPGGASFGNAGLISVDSPIPMNLPGTLRKVPRWLADPNGPLSIRPRRIPAAAPYLARWVAGSRQRRARAISDAMRALHRSAFDDWRAVLDPDLFDRFIQRQGQVLLWEEDEISRTSALEQVLRDRHGIAVRELDAAAVRDLFPGIAAGVRRGLLLPGNGCVREPGQLLAAFAERLQREGVQLVAEQVLKLSPREGGFELLTNLHDRRAERVVLAGGAWTADLLAPLGIRLPLESERGYHAHLPYGDVAGRIALPLINKSRNFGMTPMLSGLRVTGMVEIAGLAAPPRPERSRHLARQAAALFPGLDASAASVWMGHRPSTPDSLPILGELPGLPGLQLAVGSGHYGMTGGPPSAALVARELLGEPAILDPTPYRPSRFLGSPTA